MKYTITLSGRLPSCANARWHWAKKARIVKTWRTNATLLVLEVLGRVKPQPPFTITLTRYGRQLDYDNLTAAFKGVRDGVATALGYRNDNDPALTWRYAQAKARGTDERATVEIETA